MKQIVSSIAVIVLFAFSFAYHFAATIETRAEDEPVSAEDRAFNLSVLTRSMEQFTITPSSEGAAPLEFVKTPVLRYTDPVSTVKDGVVFVWLRSGRPYAVTAVHNGSRGRLWCEFLSLSPDPLTATRMGQSEWVPKKSGFEFKPVADAPPPDRAAPQRLAQMRMMLRYFSASVTDPQSGPQELRPLSQPIFRYSQSDDGVLDGGIFVFARSTNPEMLIVLEARLEDTKPVWVYSPARFTGREAELRFRGDRVWSHDVLASGTRNPADAFFQMYMLPIEPLR